MTRIDFHLNVSDHLLYTCRLIRKAYGSSLKIVCYSTRSEVLENLDKLLWTFSEEDFLPHVVSGHPGVAGTAPRVGTGARARATRRAAATRVRVVAPLTPRPPPLCDRTLRYHT